MEVPGGGLMSTADAALVLQAAQDAVMLQHRSSGEAEANRVHGGGCGVERGRSGPAPS